MTHCRENVCQPATENQGSEGQSRIVGEVLEMELKEIIPKEEECFSAVEGHVL